MQLFWWLRSCFSKNHRMVLWLSHWYWAWTCCVMTLNSWFTCLLRAGITDRYTPASQALGKILNQTVGYSADKLDPESLLSRPQLVTKGAQFSPHCSGLLTVFSAPKNTGRSFDLFTGIWPERYWEAIWEKQQDMKLGGIKLGNSKGDSK